MRPTRSLLRTLTASLAAALVLGLAVSALPGGVPIARAGTVSPDADDPVVRLVVRVDSRAAADLVAAAAGRSGARTTGRVPRLHAVSLDVPAGRAAALRAGLLRRDDVRSVEPVHRRWLLEEPADPRFAEQRTYLDAIRATTAWGRSAHGSPSVRIAVVDSGVDVTHPDLAGKVAGTFNAVKPGSGVRDLVGHGTGVASIAAAATGNGVGISGAGYDSALLVAKVADRTGRIFTDDLAAGIVWAADSGADVINLSLGGPTSDGLEKAAVDYAQRKGALVVAAAGNDGTTTRQFPAALPGVLGVGATTVNGAARASFSSYGPWVDVAAPGRSIVLASPGGGYERADGTSFSAPLVAGEAALLAAFRPGRTADELRAAITAGATPAKLGFARGVVDVDASLDLLPPATVPSVTAPADGSAVSGTATVSVSTTAPRVRIGLGDLTQLVSAAGGVATAGFATYGLDGPQTVTAADCSRIDQCGDARATVTAVVANGGPALTSPADASQQDGDTISAVAEAPADAAVRFGVEGSRVSVTDTSAPFAADLSTESLADGTHVVSAVLCRRNGSACDTAHPSRATVGVDRLHPAITGLSATRISPDGDGRADKVRVRYRLDQRATVTLRVRDASGRVATARSLGSLPAGGHEVVWNGRKRGDAVADGAYTLQVVTAAPPQSGLASRAVTVDTVAPRLRGAGLSSERVLPVRDDYLDRVTATATLKEQSRWVALEVRSSSGRLVRTVREAPRRGVAPGPVSVGWNGRDASGDLVPPGRYAVRLVAQDLAGNRRAGPARPVTLSTQRLVKQSGSLTVTARSSLTESFFDDCSLVFRHTSGKRKGWVGYDSSATCSSGDAFAAADHQVRLPAAVRYGSVRLSAFGGRGDPKFRDAARVELHDRAQNISDTAFRLAPSVGTHTGPAVPAEPLLIRHRVLRWTTATTGVAWYDVESYTVRFTYFVLR
jgi:flagellar hook assembly protein FlgD